MTERKYRYNKNKTCPECGVPIVNWATYCKIHNQKHRPEGNGKKIHAAKLINGTLLPIGTKRINSQGYVEIKITHGNGTKSQNYIAEHRKLMEEHINRPLKRNEMVHHVDGNRANNDLENNLLLMTKSQHNKLNHFLGLLTSMPDEKDRKKIMATIKSRFPSMFD